LNNKKEDQKWGYKFSKTQWRGLVFNDLDFKINLLYYMLHAKKCDLIIPEGAIKTIPKKYQHLFKLIKVDENTMAIHEQ